MNFESSCVILNSFLYDINFMLKIGFWCHIEVELTSDSLFLNLPQLLFTMAWKLWDVYYLSRSFPNSVPWYHKVSPRKSSKFTELVGQFSYFSLFHSFICLRQWQAEQLNGVPHNPCFMMCQNPGHFSNMKSVSWLNKQAGKKRSGPSMCVFPSQRYTFEYFLPGSNM